MPGAFGVVDHGQGPAARAPVVVSGKGVHAETRDDRAAWRAAWRAKLAEVLATPASSYADSARRLSALVRTGLLRFEDLVESPAKFFEAHRLLARAGFDQGPGFSIRFTVQYNLFAGTVLELGGPAHVRQLKRMQRDGTLGCFALTERLAGVNSGLVVHTTAAWVPDARQKDGGRFLLRTPTDGATKNWISQGLVAAKAVVVADLLVNDESVGPHAFLVTLRDARGRVAEGVTLTDMGRKTTGNDLDNAGVAFRDVWLARDALLDKHCDVFSAVRNSESEISKASASSPSSAQTPILKGVYVERESQNAKTPKRRLTNMDRVGQRLFTGRVAVAQGAHEFREMLFRRAREATDAKPCWVPGDAGTNRRTSRSLSDVPQLRSLYVEEARRSASTRAFLEAVEAALCASLAARRRPERALVEAVAAAKVRAVDEAIEMTHRLRQEVGSYALMAGTGFEHTDFLQCCKFAEGDSRILSQKLARDAFGEWQRNERSFGNKRPPPGWSPEEVRACARVAAAVQSAKGRGASKVQAWDAAWRDVYALADAVCARAMAGTLGEALDAKL